MLAQKLLTAGKAEEPVYIEDVFSTYLIKPSADYTTYSINNGIDLSTKGGMTWFKARDAAQNNLVYDTARGSSSGSPNALITNSTAAQQTAYFDYVTPNSNGFTVNYASGGGQLTNSGINYVSWTFRKQPKFFDVVTYTTVSGAMTIPHNLGSVPGCWIIKSISAGSTAPDWWVQHRSIPGSTLRLNGAGATESGFSTATSTNITISNGVYAAGETLVIYLFAHNAGGFGLTGTDNVISCGSVAATGGSNNVVNLGYEPQLVIIKSATVANDWHIIDNMRGFTANNGVAHLFPNSSTPEYNSGTTDVCLTSTGFTLDPNLNGFNGTGTYIYIAIRRGPMKVPTSGTSVFDLGAVEASSYGGGISMPNGDMALYMRDRFNGMNSSQFFDRLRGFPSQGASSTALRLSGNLTAAETNISGTINVGSFGSSPSDCAYQASSSNNMRAGFSGNVWELGTATSGGSVYGFRRAPSFFDEVCYTGTGSATTVTHNLGVVPELMIFKTRNNGSDWITYAAPLGATKRLLLNGTNAAATDSFPFANTAPTSTVFTVGTSGDTNPSGLNQIAYLFATCAGVSKCTAFTGTGTLQTIDCGFTAGSRFVLIKRTDAAGDWYVWDSSRGLSSSTDPYLLLNSTAAEVTSTNWVDTTATGFQVTAASGNNVNINGASYIALAIA